MRGTGEGMNVRTFCCRAILGATLSLFALGCEPQGPPEGAGENAAEKPASHSPSPYPFIDVALSRGVRFEHDNGAHGERVLPETMGGGGGFIDHDGDGDFDIVLIDGGPLAPDQPRPPNRLLINDGTGAFTEGGPSIGIGDSEPGMGLAIGDVDNDGDSDLYVANFGKNALFLNDGSGEFTRSTPEAALLSDWSSSAVFFDYDRDGALDLYVVSYLEMALESHFPCQRGELDVYCAPRDYPARIDHLLCGDGRGGFADVSTISGIRGATPGRGLGVVATDLDGDGEDDLYVANDMDLNFLFRNTRGEGAVGFLEEAVFFGGSASEDGRPQAGMGIDSGDFDGDGDFDIIVTNFEEQTNALYRNEGGVALIEVSFHVGLGATTLPFLAFGVRFLDFDLDGDLDLYIANGHVFDNPGAMKQGATHAQADQLFENRDGKFHEVLAPAVAAGAIPIRVGRAVASGDIDNDGDVDLLVVNNGGEAMLLLNRCPRSRPRVGLHLEGVSPSNRDAYGAKVTVESGLENSLRQVFEVRAGSSYLSSHDPRVLAATPGAAEARVTIRWPSGRTEVFEGVPAGAYHRIVEGEGAIRSSTPFRTDDE